MRAVGALIGLEWRLMTRDVAGLAAGAGFFAVALLIITFGLGPDPDLLRRAAPGLIWAVILLALLINADRFFAADAEDGTLDRLLLGPVSPVHAVFAKIIAHLTIQGGVMLALAPIAGAMLGLDGHEILRLLLSLLLALPSLMALTFLGAALTLGARWGHVLVPLIILPLELPILIFASGFVAAAPDQNPLRVTALLTGILLLSLVAVPVACAAALRIQGEE